MNDEDDKITKFTNIKDKDDVISFNDSKGSYTYTKHKRGLQRYQSEDGQRIEVMWDKYGLTFYDGW